jgi:aldose 1-epimerase
MSFQIAQQQMNGLPLVSLYDETTDNTVSIIPAAGALLQSWLLPHQGGYHELIDGYRDLAHLQDELSLSYRGSKLSPFACRIEHGRYTYRGQVFEFPEKFIDGNAIHGLLYSAVFELVDMYHDEEQASVLLKHNYNGENPAYPFPYRCEIRYTLLPQQRLQVETTVINLSHQDMPLQDGWHPYFNLGGSIDTYLMQWQVAAQVDMNESLIPNGQLTISDLFHSSAPLENRKLDTCFLLAEQIIGAAVTVKQPETGLQLSIYPSEQYPFLQVYTPDHRKSIAIENLSGAPDCFNNKMGLVLLPPGDAMTFTVHYQISGNQ